MILCRLHLSALASLVLIPTAVLAHHEPGDGSFRSGILHPLTGIDHWLALTAVVVWTAGRGRASVVIPAFGIGVFAGWHHWAYGGSAAAWSAGFTLATGGLLLVGLSIAYMSREKLTRWTGAAAAVCAAWIMMG